jgi:hypothetical protein
MDNLSIGIVGIKEDIGAASHRAGSFRQGTDTRPHDRLRPLQGRMQVSTPTDVDERR